jgi:uncharacterized membrane protein YjgN (DUF898 family)
MSEATEAEGESASPARTLRPEFTGSGGEYFRVWVVNLLFSLVTLGIYSAWAKVRKKKYLYGNTRLDGDSFDYFARPETILKGRIIAVAALLVYALAGQLYPESRYAFWGVAAIAAPWVIVRSLLFSARNSAWRGLRFHFNGTPGGAARVFLGLAAVTVVTLGLAYPWWVARRKRFVLGNHALGSSRFGCEVSTGSFYWVYLRALLLQIGLAVPAGFLAAVSVGLLRSFESFAQIAFLLPMVAIYAAYLMVYGYVQARTTNLLWNGTYGPGLRFESDLRAWKLIGIYFSNVLAAVFSAGLLIPWAVVRTLKYRLSCLAVIVEQETVHEADPAYARVGATGEELGDFFNLDLGI